MTSTCPLCARTFDADRGFYCKRIEIPILISPVVPPALVCSRACCEGMARTAVAIHAAAEAAMIAAGEEVAARMWLAAQIEHAGPVARLGVVADG